MFSLAPLKLETTGGVVGGYPFPRPPLPLLRLPCVPDAAVELVAVAGVDVVPAGVPAAAWGGLGIADSVIVLHTLQVTLDRLGRSINQTTISFFLFV
jgi:hypothetical protein